MLTLYGTPKSRAFRPLWLLEELELDFVHKPVPPHDSALKKLNPSGKVPVLVANGVTITDSTAILTYLADREGKLTHPAGSLDRAKQDAVMFQALDELDSCLWTAARHSFVLPEDRRVPEVKDSLKWEFSRAIDRMATHLKDREFVTGDDMTIADIVVTHCGGWAVTAKFPLENDTFRAYLDRMRARPAYIRAAGR
ncbi:glutathione S-transferase family protein [Maribius pontilimi]|uniref:Glutathione S-transferase family protein n=1 Tax=Palleronia pontilimi TaxID=1964209 RepID=A0A934IF36_9RHOB|nr:glutathione S-transferase family protein [Palleronia pontilimi]MBJ3763252.1 glutathione S-transferase family protein [Palleronia pontilimi]